MEFDYAFLFPENDKLQLTLAVEDVMCNLSFTRMDATPKSHFDLEVKRITRQLIFEITDQGRPSILLDYEIP